MTFSLIVPCYQKRSRIEKMFWRLSNSQTPKHDFEVVLVDGGSTDGIEEVVEQYKDKLNLIFIRSGATSWENPSRARNIGYRVAQGVFSIMLDGDYLPGEDMMEEFRRVMTGRTLLSYGYAIDSSHGLGYHKESVFDNKFGDTPLYQMPIRKMMMLTGLPVKPEKLPEWLFCVSTDIMKQIHGYDEDYKGWGREDSDMYSRLNSYDLVRVDTPMAICVHIFHPSAGPNGQRDSSENHKLFEEKNKGLPNNVVRNGTYYDGNWGCLRTSGSFPYSYRDTTIPVYHGDACGCRFTVRPENFNPPVCGEISWDKVS